MTDKTKNYQDNFQPPQMMPLDTRCIYDHFVQPPQYLDIPQSFNEPEQAIFYDNNMQTEKKPTIEQQYQSLSLLTMGEVSQYLEIGKRTYQNETRQDKLERYRRKKSQRKWGKKISYTCRQSVAKQRLRVKGRFVSKGEAFSIQKYNKEQRQLMKMSEESTDGKEKGIMLECG